MYAKTNKQTNKIQFDRREKIDFDCVVSNYLLFVCVFLIYYGSKSIAIHWLVLSIIPPSTVALVPIGIRRAFHMCKVMCSQVDVKCGAL